MASIETTGREALVEDARLLGVLRSDAGPAPLEPQQGLAGIGTVIAGADRAGVVVELVIEGDPQPFAARPRPHRLPDRPGGPHQHRQARCPGACDRSHPVRAGTPWISTSSTTAREPTRKRDAGRAVTG
jgi:hypothetical protein